MALVNQSKREINVKVVYTGLPGAGKTANLSVIYQRLKPEFRGQERSIPMGGCAMQLCEFQLPGTGALPGFATRYHLYTLTGAEIGDEQWRMVLKGADGIVFVMDTDPARSLANFEAFAGLLGQLNSLGFDLSQLPIVVQANSQLSGVVLNEAEVLRQLSMPGLTAISAQVAQGDGVLETLTTLVRKITAVLQKLEIPAPEESDDVGSEEHDDLAHDPEVVEPCAAVVPAETVTALDQMLPLMPIHLTSEGGIVEVPICLMVSGLEKEYLLSLSLREVGTVQCEPLRGSVRSLGIKEGTVA
jgi:hypothetical protein